MAGEISWDLDGNDKVEFTKFPAGTTHIRVLDNAPHIRWTHWMNGVTKDGKGRSVNCPGIKICPIDDIISKQKANGEQPKYNQSRRFAMNIFNYETNRVEIMEQGKTFMEDLKMVMADLKEDGKDLSDVKLKIRRTGTGREDTKYRIDIDSDVTDPIPDGVTDLMEYFKPHTVEQINRLLKGEKWEDVMSEGTQEESDNDSDEEVQVK